MQAHSVQARTPGIQRAKPLDGSEIGRGDIGQLCGSGLSVGVQRYGVGSFELFFSSVLEVE